MLLHIENAGKIDENSVVFLVLQFKSNDSVLNTQDSNIVIYEFGKQNNVIEAEFENMKDFIS